MPFLAKVPGKDGGEVRIPLGREHAEAVAARPKDKAGEPLLEAETERSSHGPIHNRKRAWRAAQKDGLDQRAMNPRFEAVEMMAGAHPIIAPPPKLKKLRKKDDAAKAIDRPKMI